ncbi:hypothetical protein, partial [uncultured Lamprocystis sp.]
MAIPEILKKIRGACTLDRLKPRPPVAGTMTKVGTISAIWSWSRVIKREQVPGKGGLIINPARPKPARVAAVGPTVGAAHGR